MVSRPGKEDAFFKTPAGGAHPAWDGSLGRPAQVDIGRGEAYATPSKSSPLGAIGLLIATLAGLVYLSLGGLAGDTVIHLVFAEHALAGRWFEFNPGIPSGGESSPLYMLYVAALYWLFGPMGVPYALQSLGIVAWAVLLLGVWRAALTLGAGHRWTLVIVAMVGLMPGSARNAVLGMENVYFGAGVVWWTLAALRVGWFDRPLPWQRELVMAVVAGLLACLRPEGVAVVAVVMTARAYMLRDSGVLLRYVVGALVAAALFGAQTYWYWELTGTLPFWGGMARQALAEAQGSRLLGMPLNFKVLARWAAYMPLTLMLSLGIWGLLQLRRSHERGVRVPLAHQRMAWAMIWVVLVLTWLFMTVFSSVHLGRYTIFYWPLAILGAWVGAGPTVDHLWSKGGVKRGCVWLALGTLAAVYATEAAMRVRILGPGHALADVAIAPLRREMNTASALARLEAADATTARPVVVGMVEVQMRYWWDARIQVVSLDGIVDKRLLPFVRDGYYDHMGFAKAVGLTRLLEFPNFNRDPNDFALADLVKLNLGDVVVRDGVRLEKLASGAVKVGN
jgi:hypothetical protein